ncbi:MAG: hypothetical protein ACI8RU_002291, partial [Zhongshania aliphaticivorans]
GSGCLKVIYEPACSLSIFKTVTETVTERHRL